MELTRREFMKLCSASAVGMGLSQMAVPKLVHAMEEASAKKPPVIWLQGANCTGCVVSLLNTAHPTIAEVLTKIISLEYQTNVMAASGELAFSYLDAIAEKTKGEFFLLREGAIALEKNWTYRTIKEQLAYEAIKMGVHSALTVDMVLMSKAILWIQENEIALIKKLNGN